MRFSGRPPLLPLVLAGLERLGLLPWFPVVLLVGFVVALFFFARSLSRTYGWPCAAAATATLFASFTLRGLVLEVMADVVATALLGAALGSFLVADSNPRRYLWFGIWGGLSASTQQAALLLPLSCVLVLLVQRRRHLRSPYLWLGATVFALPEASWLLFKWLNFGTVGGLLVHPWLLVRPHLSSVGFYAFAMAGFYGLPALLLGALGCVRLARQACSDRRALFLLAVAASLLGFFVLFYDYNDRRFLVYLAPASGFFIAASLAAMRPAVAALASAVAMLWACVPFPGGWSESSRVTLWPLPPIYASAPVVSLPSPQSVDVDLGGLHIETAPIDAIFSAGILSRALGAHAARTVEEPPSPALFRIDRAAILLDDSPHDHPDLEASLQLGITLRKRVRLLPFRLYAPWAAKIQLEPLGTADQHAVFRGRLPYLEESCLFVVARASPLQRRLRDGEVGSQSASAEPARALANARAIVDFLRCRALRLAVVPIAQSPRLEYLYLAVLTDAQDFGVADPGDQRLVTRLRRRPPKAELEVDGLRVWTTTLLGARSAVVADISGGLPPV
ncbi:MAG TPA: hypothetical protein VHR45_07760 [Thermoanaerobaculia bacterium]|nr:hypothetical protein [Thermoanaerobaculia bacterium]